MIRFTKFVELMELKSFPVETNPVSVKVYHGSGHHFDKFDQSKSRIKNDFMGGGIGYFTSHPEVAKTYASSMARKANTGTPYVYTTTIKMKNVFDVDHDFTGEKLKHVLPSNPKDHEQFARSAGLMSGLSVDKYKVLDDLRTGKLSLKGSQVFKGLSRGGVNSAAARLHLMKKGYDGLRYNGGENMNMATKHDVYMPYYDHSITIHKVEKV